MSSQTAHVVRVYVDLTNLLPATSSLIYVKPNSTCSKSIFVDLTNLLTAISSLIYVKPNSTCSKRIFVYLTNLLTAILEWEIFR